MIDEINKILKLKDDLPEKQKLPSGCAFLTDDIILAYPQADGNARYPYACDGMTLWAYAAGEIVINESKFNIFPDTTRGLEPTIAFFVGEQTDKGLFRPISVTGVAQRGAESDVERFTVFTPKAAYYFAVANFLLSVVRVFIDKCKRPHFDIYVKNKAGKCKKSYIAAYLNPLLTNNSNEGFWDKCYRKGEVTSGGGAIEMTEFLFGERVTHFCRIESSAKNARKTTARSVFCGGINRGLAASTSLECGRFGRDKNITAFDETAIYGEIAPITLNDSADCTVEYMLSLSNMSNGCKQSSVPPDDREPCLTGGDHAPIFSFGSLNGKFSPYEKTFTPFINTVMRQTEFCTMSKNYAGSMIGMRDIFQQIEGALPTIPEYCRKKITEALSYIGDDGRPPRQYSYPITPELPPAMDLREYIDQGAWIISTVYSYLCWTGDLSILSEVCGYYKLAADRVLLSERKDSVFDHLVSIADYLIFNIDENTNCLKALYGDWNDALDGLGKTNDPNRKFGNGVSVMTTLQLYKCLGELCEIVERIGKRALAEKYSTERARIKRGLENNAVVTRSGGSKKVLHGWGDNKSFFVGSDGDCDGKSRDGLTSNAYWVLSGMLNDSCTVDKADILSAYERLDSKYGLKTFEPYFAETCAEVGRLSRLPKGAAENGAVYIHATLFAIRSLFEMGESAAAWEQIYKILPITHEYVSTSPFVMSNSYAENPDLGLDGQSISDWYTGSGCVLVKAIVGDVFGIKPTLDGVVIRPAVDPPFDKGECTVVIKGKRLTVRMRRDGISSDYMYIPDELLQDGQTVTVFFN